MRTHPVASRPLEGKRVVVTRAREQAGDLVERLRALGAEPVECAAISIAPLHDTTKLDSAIFDLLSYDWVIFTSVNGVEAFLDRFARLGRDITELKTRKIAAIGPATAASLDRAGCKPSFVPDTYVAEAILEQIGDVRGCKVLLPRADIARKALADGLRDKGAEVDEVTAYRTVPGEGSDQLAALLRDKKVDAITFTSSSTVRYTLEGLANTESQPLELLNRTGIVCIGPITAATAKECGLQVTKVADEYTIDGLVDALVEVLGAKAGVMGGQHA